MGVIVVGHDGSKAAQESVKEAFELARDLGAPLNIIRAYSLRESRWPKDVPFGYVPTHDELEAYVRQSLETDVASMAAEYPQVQPTLEVIEGHAAAVLIARSEAPDIRMMIVGSRGLGGFPRLLLGSISEQLVQHARCPVLVIRH